MANRPKTSYPLSQPSAPLYSRRSQRKSVDERIEKPISSLFLTPAAPSPDNYLAEFATQWPNPGEAAAMEQKKQLEQQHASASRPVMPKMSKSVSASSAHALKFDYNFPPRQQPQLQQRQSLSQVAGRCKASSFANGNAPSQPPKITADPNTQPSALNNSNVSTNGSQTSGKNTSTKRKQKRLLADLSNLSRKERVVSTDHSNISAGKASSSTPRIELKLTPLSHPEQNEQRFLPEVMHPHLSSFEKLHFQVLDAIMDYVPLRQRLLVLARLSRRLYNSVRRSVTAVAFFGDQLDGLSDTQIEKLLAVHRNRVHSLNFDLYKSGLGNEVSQWQWRESIRRATFACHSLRSLTALVCTRHRLRDEDLLIIFRQCPLLSTLRVDAQFLTGRCFVESGGGDARPQVLEMDMCYRFKAEAMLVICSKLRLQSLYVSQMLCLDDRIVKRMSQTLRALTDLTIVSHPKSAYKLTGGGLAQLNQLPRLRTLCLEGLTAVTDRFLQFFSDPTVSVAASRIVSVSLAFCYNISSAGLACLSRLPQLEDLNLDGVTKRDMSAGLEYIARGGRLRRLLLAEGANVSPECLMKVVESCPQLCHIDIVNNPEILNWSLANKILRFWEKSGRSPLTILTSDHLAWNGVQKTMMDEFGRRPVRVVHASRESLDPREVNLLGALEETGPSGLERAFFAPQLRRGTRYRLMWQPLGPSNNPMSNLPHGFNVKDEEVTPEMLEQMAKLLEEEQRTLGEVTRRAHSVASTALEQDSQQHLAFDRASSSSYFPSIFQNPSMDVQPLPWFSHSIETLAMDPFAKEMCEWGEGGRGVQQGTTFSQPQPQNSQSQVFLPNLMDFEQEFLF